MQLERLADHAEVYWVLQGEATGPDLSADRGEKLQVFLLTVLGNPPAADPVNEEALSDSRKMITNQQLELYNEAAVDVLKSSRADGSSRVKLLAASRQAAMETIAQSDDGLHLPESTRNVVGRCLRMFPLPASECCSCSVTLLSSASGSHGAHELCVQ